MLKLQNVFKTYRSKKGEAIKALNNVNINLDETGMVFILGKSGSGKSTFLNVIGGLDSYDSGDIIIKDKSTKDFKQSDFDSYRNTLVGFIFQEYNLLEDLSVFENIQLALELQGKKGGKEEIENILIDVDLEGYGSRRINELSGGQKQRVVIARALVKDPKIIMADEPTGALDSETGIQVLKILKRLSKKRLVIVVSHEREFAEEFGSRIIELKDGYVINDLTKNIKTNKFIQTIDDKKQLEDVNEEYKPVKSRLPFKSAFKFSLSSLNNRKLRLILSIILASISFALFGITDSLASYKQNVASVNSMINADVGYASFTKHEKYYDEVSDDYKYMDKKFSNEEINEFNAHSDKINFIPIIKDVENVHLSIYEYFNDNASYRSGAFYYRGYLSGLTTINMETLNLFNYELIGSLANNDNEIVITKFQYDNFKELGILQLDEFGNERPLEFSKKEEFLNLRAKIELGEYEFEIVGIIDTKFDTSRYLAFKNSNTHNTYQAILEYEYKELIDYTLHNVMFLNNDTFYNLIELGNRRLKTQNYFSIGTAISKQSIIYFNSFEKLELNKVSFINNNNTESLSNKKVVLKLSNNPDFKLVDLLPTKHYTKYNQDYLEKAEGQKDFDFLISFINDNNIKLETEILSKKQFSNETTTRTYEIAGIIEANDIVNEIYFDYENALYFNKEEYDELSLEKDLIYDYIYTVIPNDKTLISKLINYHYDKSSTNYKIHNEVVVTIDNANDIIVLLSKISFYIGIGFLIFAAVLLFNFISLSVEFKKQEIGILRALGATKKDVVKIFFMEATTIAIINFIVASLISVISILFINKYLKNDYGLIISIISFGLRQLFIMLLISLLVAYLSSSIPVRRIANKNPIDAIRER